MDKLPCLPVKITDKKWADKLQDGSVYFRALHFFGSWSIAQRAQQGDAQMKSGVQGDSSEGTVLIFDTAKEEAFMSMFPPELRKVMRRFAYLKDQERYQYYKVFCMYGLTFIPNQGVFETPDPRIAEFGDTAVIFHNPNEFLDRVLREICHQYGDSFNFRMDETHYYPSGYVGELDEFCKAASYAWQNEMRMRIALTDENITITDPDGCVRKRLVQSTDPVILEIGDIRDISIQIPVVDLLELKLPDIIHQIPPYEP